MGATEELYRVVKDKGLCKYNVNYTRFSWRRNPAM